jgi:hypothetical protein
MKKLKFFPFLIFIALSNLFFLINIQAQDTAITFTPSQIIVKENDLGKRYTITVNNPSEKPYTFIAEEQKVKIEGETLTITTEETEKRLEISKNEFTVEAMSKAEIIVRVKIFTNENFDSFPALILKEKAGKTDKIDVLIQAIIPFIVQNTKGESLLDSTMSINAQNYTIDPNLIIDGTVSNLGSKFFNPAGIIVISKNGVKIDEIEITSQIEGLFYPNDVRTYKIDWINDKDYLEGVGEYTVESRITNDETNNVTVNIITFIYIPKNLILLVGGILSCIILLIGTIKIIKIVLKKKAVGKVSG